MLGVGALATSGRWDGPVSVDDHRPDFQQVPSALGKLKGARKGIGGFSFLAEVIDVDAVGRAVGLFVGQVRNLRPSEQISRYHLTLLLLCPDFVECDFEIHAVGFFNQLDAGIDVRLHEWVGFVLRWLGAFEKHVTGHEYRQFRRIIRLQADVDEDVVVVTFITAGIGMQSRHFRRVCFEIGCQTTFTNGNPYATRYQVMHVGGALGIHQDAVAGEEYVVVHQKGAVVDLHKQVFTGTVVV